MESSNLVLLKHDKMNYFWVMRYPKDIQSNEKFTAFLNEGFVCHNRQCSICNKQLFISDNEQTEVLRHWITFVMMTMKFAQF